MVPFLNKGPAISAQHGISMRMIFHKKDVLSVQHPTELHPNLAIVVARNRQLNRDKLRVHSSFMMVPMQCGWCIPIHYITILCVQVLGGRPPGDWVRAGAFVCTWGVTVCRSSLPFARECRLGVWFGFVGAALLPAGGTCVVLAFGAMPGR